MPSRGLPGLKKITLVEIEAIFGYLIQQIMVLRGDDLFACDSEDGSEHQAVPTTGRITRALFKVLFSDGHCIRYELRNHGTSSWATALDAQILERWLLRSHFTAPGQAPFPIHY